MTLRVIQLVPELNEGGVERGTCEISREFSKQGINSIVISNGGKLSQLIEQHGGTHLQFDVCSKNPLTAPVRISKLKKLFKHYKPDIIHVRSRVPAWLSFFARKNLQLPMVTTVHGINSVNPYSKIMTEGDQVICVGKPVKNHICKHYKTNPAKITVIPRGVDLSYFDHKKVNPDTTENLIHSFNLKGKIVICSVGRISRVKNFEVIISAIAKLSEVYPNIIGLIVGGEKNEEDEYSKSLKMFAEKICPNRIVWTGSRIDMREIYTCCDVVVNSSPKMGNVARTLVEGLAMNKPILSTEMKGLDHIIKDGVNGYTIRSGDVDDLFHKLKLILKLKITSTRDSIPSEFTLDSMVNSTLGVYEKALR